MKNLFISKSRDDNCVLFKRQATRDHRGEYDFQFHLSRLYIDTIARGKFKVNSIHVGIVANATMFVLDTITYCSVI